MRAFLFRVFLVTICFGQAAFAVDLPTYLPALKGVVVENLLETQGFEFTPGALKRCERKVVSENWVSYDCVVEGASCRVEGNGKTQVFDFNHVFAFFRHAQDTGFTNEYILDGRYQDSSLSSRVRLTLTHPRKEPVSIKGTLSLEEYGVSRGIQALPK